MTLKDKSAIVTGAGRGIGRAIALKLAEEGADIVIVDIDMENANRVVSEIRTLHREAIAVRADVTKREDVNQMAKTVLDKFGKIDILVNNAGGSARERNALFHESAEEIWDWVIALNLKGTLLCTRAVINHMIQRGSGKIINLGSVSGMIGQYKIVDYCAAKGGVIAFTKALAKEVSPLGINVNCVSPGGIQTAATGWFSEEELVEKKKLSYLKRLGTPDEVANTVAFLASDGSSYITGQNIPICGGRNLGI